MTSFEAKVRYIALMCPHHYFRGTKTKTVLGKGLVILLHGAPGVGKSFTAGQSVSIEFCYSISDLRPRERRGGQRSAPLSINLR